MTDGKTAAARRVPRCHRTESYAADTARSSTRPKVSRGSISRFLSTSTRPTRVSQGICVTGQSSRSSRKGSWMTGRQSQQQQQQQHRPRPRRERFNSRDSALSSVLEPGGVIICNSIALSHPGLHLQVSRAEGQPGNAPLAGDQIHRRGFVRLPPGTRQPSWRCVSVGSAIGAFEDRVAHLPLQPFKELSSLTRLLYLSPILRRIRMGCSLLNRILRRIGLK